MNVLLDDLVDGIVQQVEEKVLPTLETVTQRATERLSNFANKPPASTDLVYLTDRLVVLSQPAPSPKPTFLDHGRDIRSNQKSNQKLSPLYSQASSLGDSTDGDTDDDDSSLHEPLETLKSAKQQQVEEEDVVTHNSTTSNDSVFDRLYKREKRKEKLWKEPPTPTPARSSHRSNPQTIVDTTATTATTVPDTDPSENDDKDSQQQPLPTIHNSPATIVTYLDKRHGSDHYLAYSLTNEPPDDRTLLLFRRQIVQLGWWSPCKERSETPAISKLIKICYAIHAFLQVNEQNIALVYCHNGKTRTAITVACYLKFAGLVQHSYQGFLHFLSKKGIPESTWKQLPPSLHLFFRQFDTALEMGGFLNRKPLMLRAITLQGIPVEQKPCLDIWDASQRHVYSSHPEMWKEDESLPPSFSQWADEEGFYKVNVTLEGDFLLLCRFGGDFAKETTIHDPSKILFRYANTTGFLSGGCPYELPPNKVDLMRRYAPHLDDDDFLVTLLFQADWENTSDDKQQPSNKICGERIWQCHEQKALEEGWNVIFQCHSARPDASDIGDFQTSFPELELCAGHLVCLALQLSNFQYQSAKQLLLESHAFSWWRRREIEPTCTTESPDDQDATPTSDNADPKEKKDLEQQGILNSELQHRKDAENAQQIFDILDEVDISKHLEPMDVEKFQYYENASIKTRQAAPSTSQQTPKRRNTVPRNDATTLFADDFCLRDSGWMVPSALAYPREGDIASRFGYTQPQHSRNQAWSSPPTFESQAVPHVPYFPHERPAVLPPSSKRRRKDSSSKSDEFAHPIQPYDPIREEAMQLYLQMQHTGITLSGLINLVETSQRWSNSPILLGEELEGGGNKGSTCDQAIKPSASKEASMNREAKEQKEKEWTEAREAEEKERVEKKKGEDAKKKDEEAKRMKEGSSAGDAEVPLKDDADYAKYFKMLKMGMSKEQVIHAMTRDEKDPKVLELDPNKSLESQIPEQPEGEVPLKKDPEYEKYFKMLRMGLPKDAVKNALMRDGKDPAVMDLDPEKSVASQMAKTGNDDGPALKDDPDYQKYFKMLAMGLPVDAVKNALTRDGKDPGIMDLDPNKTLQSQKAGPEDTGVPMKEDPEYAKYFKMLSMGLPKDAVKNAVERDGKDPSILDLDPNKSVVFQLKTVGSSKKSPPKKKKRIRRKKIFWNPINPKKLHRDSMWNIVQDAVSMNKLNYDLKEFEELFTESADPGDKKKKKTTEKAPKKLVQVIDAKRSMNGGIIMARLRVEYAKIADIVRKMEHNKFDSTQLNALNEFLPDADERRGLIGYMQNPKVPKETLYTDLSETEKYMHTMMEVTEAGAKIKAMLFRSNFKNRFEDINAGIRTLNAACDELRSSEKFRKLMAMILSVVNQINTGGEGNMAIGFTLDALLKLNEAKAFDKKTSVLHYVVKLVKKNDETLLTFDSDLGNAIPAESVLLDSLGSDVKSLGEELVGVHKTVQAEAQRLEENGELKPMTLEDLKEQRTSIRQVGSVSQFNKMDHHTGRTSMERFTVNAHYSCEQASASIDDVKKKFVALLNYFGENEQMQTGDFFGILRRFMSEFRKAVEQVEAIEMKAAKEKKREAARAAKAAKQDGKKKIRRPGKKVPTKQRKKPKVPVSENDKAENKEKTKSDLLAAMAATVVSRQKGQVRADNNDVVPSPLVDGIAAMATAGAAVKGQAKPPEESSRQSNLPIGNVSKSVESTLGPEQPVERKATRIENSVLVESTSERDEIDDSNRGAAKEIIAGREHIDSDVDSSSQKRGLVSKTAEHTVDGAEEAGEKSLFTELSLTSTFTEKIASVENIGNSENGIDDVTDVEEPTSKINDGELPEEPIPAKTNSPPPMRLDESNLDHDLEQSDNIAAADRLSQILEERASQTLEEPTIENEIQQAVMTSELRVASTNKPLDAKQLCSKSKEEYAKESSRASIVSASEESGEEAKTAIETPKISPVPIPEPKIPHKAPPASQDDATGEDAQLDTEVKSADELSVGMSSKSLHLHKEEGVVINDMANPATEGNGQADDKEIIKTVVSTPRSISEAREPEQAKTNIPDKGSTQEMGNSRDVSSGQQDLKGQSIDVSSTHLKRGKASRQSNSKFLSSAKEYRRKKSTRNLYAAKDVDDTTGAVEELASPKDSKRQLIELDHKPMPTKESNTSDDAADAKEKDETPRPPPFGISELSPMQAQRKSIQKGIAGMMSPTGGAQLGDFLERSRQASSRRLGDFLDGNHDSRSEMLRKNFDDSSVAQIANQLSLEHDEVGMSGTWTEGDKITNWMGWADQVIKASDSDSVVDFEMPRDLNDGLDFDDDSTIASYASYYDDLSVASGLETPKKVSAYVSLDNFGKETLMSPSFDPYFEESGKEPDPRTLGTGKAAAVSVTPAQVAASILFEDSPTNSVDISNTAVGLDAGLSFGGDVNLDSGLTFGADAGFDDGLGGFGDSLADVGFDDGLGGFGGTESFNFGNDVGPNVPRTVGSQPEKRETENKNRNWFGWGGGN